MSTSERTHTMTPTTTGHQKRCTSSGDVDECFRGESTLVVPAKFLICRTARDTRKTAQLELCTNKLTFSLVCALFSFFLAIMHFSLLQKLIWTGETGPKNLKFFLYFISGITCFYSSWPWGIEALSNQQNTNSVAACFFWFFPSGVSAVNHPPPSPLSSTCPSLTPATLMSFLTTSSSQVFLWTSCLHYRPQHPT